jgi:hypothetical protein
MIIKQQPVMEGPPPKDTISTELGRAIYSTIITDTSLVQTDKYTTLAGSQATFKKILGNNKWKIDLVSSLGISFMKTGLFGNRSVFSGSGALSPLGLLIGPAAAKPNDPGQGLAFTAGLGLAKPLTKKVEFLTGLQYSFLSYPVKTGSPVDTVVNLTVLDKSYTPDRYYTLGFNNKYVNTIHLLGVPLQFKFHPGAHTDFPLFINGGFILSRLIQSNALALSRNPAVYFTDKSMFNKWMVGIGIGAGLTINRKQINLFSIGYQFNYHVSSLSKKPNEAQHPSASFIMLRVPLKN